MPYPQLLNRGICHPLILSSIPGTRGCFIQFIETPEMKTSYSYSKSGLSFWLGTGRRRVRYHSEHRGQGLAENSNVLGF